MDNLNNTKVNEFSLENYSNIETLALMSIHTDRGAWWADTDFGSELYTLKGSKITNETPSIVCSMLIECLAWLKKDELAKDIEIETKLKDKNSVYYKVVIIKPEGKNILIEDVWQC